MTIYRNGSSLADYPDPWPFFTRGIWMKTYSMDGISLVAFALGGIFFDIQPVSGLS